MKIVDTTLPTNARIIHGVTPSAPSSALKAQLNAIKGNDLVAPSTTGAFDLTRNLRTSLLARVDGEYENPRR
jgi:hypothetical protein